MTAPLFAVISAAPMPWTSRKTMIEASSHDRAHSAEPTMKTTKPASYIRTRPNMSPSRPTCDASKVTTRRYPMITQITEVRAT